MALSEKNAKFLEEWEALRQNKWWFVSKTTLLPSLIFGVLAYIFGEFNPVSIISWTIVTALGFVQAHARFHKSEDRYQELKRLAR